MSRSKRQYGVLDVSREIKEEIRQQELRLKKEEFKIRMKKLNNLTFKGTINKKVVRNTNNSDRKYLSLTEDKLNEYNEYLSLRNEIHLYIKYYSNKGRKRLDDHEYQIEHKTIIRLEKMGVRSYNKNNPAKNIYRVRYYTPTDKFLEECNIKLLDSMKMYKKDSKSYKELEKQYKTNLKDLKR